MPKTGSTARPAAKKNNSKPPATTPARDGKKPVASAPTKDSAKPPAAASSGSALEIKDTRTGKTYTRADRRRARFAPPELKKIKTDARRFGLMSYDPAFMNTASCKSAITFIDGDKGILRYRGYPIEQLAEKATFLEVAWLLRHGELPTQKEYDTWVHDITYHTYVHENIKTFLAGLPLRRAPDVDALQRGRGAVVVLSRSEEHLRSGRARTSRSSACSRSCRRSPRSATAT